jgi:hypothetical protein
MGRVNKYVKEGDVVLISGLYGNDVNFANNKLGYIQQIMTVPNNGSLNFAANVQLDLNTLLPINFVFLYNIKTLHTIDDILLDPTYLSRYLIAKKSVHNGFIADGNGNNSAFIISKDNSRHILTISTLN